MTLAVRGGAPGRSERNRIDPAINRNTAAASARASAMRAAEEALVRAISPERERSQRDSVR